MQRLLDADPNKPRLARTYQDRFFPGSTFKVVTATAGILHGGVTADEPVYPHEQRLHCPRARPDRSATSAVDRAAARCSRSCAVSCNTAFAQMGVDTGADAMIDAAEAFGFNQDVPIDLTAPARSNFPTDFERTPPALAQSSIGQNEVAATPLQMAMVAGAVANADGEVMMPHVLRDVRDQDGNVVDTYDPEVWTTAMDRATAALMREAMRGVVDSGTATGLAVPGFDVGGKTGTAQLGTDPARSHAWIIGFGGPDRRRADHRGGRHRRGPAGRQRADRRPGGRAHRPGRARRLPRGLSPWPGGRAGPH